MAGSYRRSNTAKWRRLCERAAPAAHRKQFIRVLERKGWQHDRGRGSHQVYIHPATRRTLSVPMAKRTM
jgi:predicted RNA binding protein YcfA (HicA-like mRNA interferase family)